MGATHIVSNDLQLWLGVHPGAVGQQQIAAQLGGIGALGFTGHRDRAIENGVGATGGQAFLQLIEFTLRAVEAHRGVGGQLLLSAGDGQPLERGLGLTIHLDHPGFDPAEGPALDHGGQGVGTAGLLLHSQMRQEGGFPIGRRHKAMAQPGLLAQMGFQHVAVG